jgi:hypothetical protein
MYAHLEDVRALAAEGRFADLIIPETQVQTPIQLATPDNRQRVEADQPPVDVQTDQQFDEDGPFGPPAENIWDEEVW